jgi:hypothetical protein
MRHIALMPNWLGNALVVLGVLSFVFGGAAIGTMVAQAQAQPRAQVWAEEVESCEKRGGVAVVRATRALGRSAELPVCVALIGTE